MPDSASPVATSVPAPLRFDGDVVLILDERKLPASESWMACRSPDDVAEAITSRAVVGAPAIEAAAAFGLVLATREGAAGPEAFERACGLLQGASTAPAVHAAISSGRQAYEQALRHGRDGVHAAMLARAEAALAEGLEIERRLAIHASSLFAAGDRVLVRGITSRLAAVLAAIAREHGRSIEIRVAETRSPPLERPMSSERGPAYTPVQDASTGALMARGLVDRVVLGAARIAVNGDVVGDIGTYALAILAWHHEVPVHVVAARSTLDPQADCGEAIGLGARDPGKAIATDVAFDVTPAYLVGAIVTEVGISRAPHERPSPDDAARPEIDAGATSRRSEPGRPAGSLRAARERRSSVGVDAELVDRLADVGRRLHARGWLPGTGGNFSAVIRREPLRMAVTATGTDLASITSEDLLVVDEQGAVLHGSRRASSELPLHLGIRRSRPEAAVVLHTHSTWSTLVSLSDDRGVMLTGYEQLKGLAGISSSEQREWLPVLDNEQAIPALARLAVKALAESETSHGLLLRGHGLYTWGTCIAEAVRHVESLEFLLELHARRAGTPNAGQR